MEPAFRLCESHPGRLLTEHLLDVASRLQRYGPLCRLTGLFHDLGKATHFFQEYLRDQPTEPRLKQHAQLGALWLLETLLSSDSREPGFSVLDIAVAYLIVRRHHSRFDDLRDSFSASPDDRRLWQTQLSALDRDGLAQWLEQASGLRPIVPTLALGGPALRVNLDRALKKATDPFQAMFRFQSALQSFGRLIEADRDSAAGYSPGVFDQPPQFVPAHVTSFRDAGRFGSTSTPGMAQSRNLVFDAAVSSATAVPLDSGHLWSLTVPTGAGKTLAAIGWALSRRQARVEVSRSSCPIIYALPFTSIIDQNAAVLQNIWPEAECDETVLSVHHHLAEPGDLAQAGEESLARSWVEGWRSDVICTTFVQVFNALFHATAADSRRFSKLAGSILILDEVQAVPAHLWPVLRTALLSLSRNFGTDILLLTATQPALFGEAEVREIIRPTTLPAECAAAFDRYDLHLEVERLVSLEDVCRRIAVELGPDPPSSCLVILNTVREALTLHGLVAASPAFRDVALFHLSTNLRPKDRKAILQEVSRGASNRRILIATQVVEAGVDLSFDVVVRALAPLDSVVQAAGRCNRHGTGRRGKVIVIKPEGNKGILIYGPVHMDLAARILQTAAATACGDVIAEPALVRYVSEFFSELPRLISGERARAVGEAIQMLEFASLRGEGVDERDREKKMVRLIVEEDRTIPHFIETDASDAAVWQQFLAALRIPDPRVRRVRLRSLRPQLSDRIVEVPHNCALHDPDDKLGIVPVPIQDSARYYNTQSGWKRPL